MNPRKLSILAFCFFNAWLLSFAYEGQILYAVLGAQGISSAQLIRSAILAHAVGLFVCGFFVRTLKCAQNVMMIGTAICFAGSSLFFFPVPLAWTVSLLVISFTAGLWNAAWGFCCRAYSAPQERMATVAASIAGATAMMVVLNLAAVYLHPFAGLLPAMLCLALACAFLARCRCGGAPEKTPPGEVTRLPLGSAFTLLCLFILAVTVTSGLMFQVVNPAFAPLGLLPTLYWAVPYIAAMLAAARLPRRLNRSYILYLALAMIGFGFLAFLVLDRSAASYLLVNTLLLGAFGITDLFWWSILGEMLDFRRNPARVMGTGLAVNVAGVLLGESLSGLIRACDADRASVTVALAAVCAAVVILPILYNRLTVLLKNSAFLQMLESLPPGRQKQTIDELLGNPALTAREREIAALLLKGYTYRLIAQELYISESTVKTHIQNIYGKLDVRSKAELIQQLRKQ